MKIEHTGISLSTMGFLGVRLECTHAANIAYFCEMYRKSSTRACICVSTIYLRLSFSLKHQNRLHTQRACLACEIYVKVYEGITLTHLGLLGSSDGQRTADMLADRVCGW
jgi:hypothetical protein